MTNISPFADNTRPIENIYDDWRDGLLTSAEALLHMQYRRTSYRDNAEDKCFDTVAFPEIVDFLYTKEIKAT